MKRFDSLSGSLLFIFLISSLLLCCALGSSDVLLDGPACQADLASVACGFDDDGVILNADDSADDAADGDDLICDFDVLTHLLNFFISLLLRTDQQEAVTITLPTDLKPHGREDKV